MSEVSTGEATEGFSIWRTWTEVVTVIVLSFAGLLLGGWTGWVPLGPILGVVLPIAAASAMLKAEGSSWRDLGFARARRRRWT